MVNFRQIQNQVLRRARISNPDSHRLQLVRDIINGTIQDMLSRQHEWDFLNRTAEILSEVDRNTYALPREFGSLIGVEVNEVRAQIFRNRDVRRHISTTANQTTSASTRFSATLNNLTTAPFADSGFVFPTFGSKQVVGSGTSFDSRVAGRYFASERDGQIYRVQSLVDSGTINLAQEFTGSSQAGLVNIPSDDLTIVNGNPHVTNWTADMAGLLIKLEGTASNISISSVDVERQVITLATAADAAGNDLIYSIQDNYQIDPPGRYQIVLYPTPTEADRVISVDYTAIHTDLTGDQDYPVIPHQFREAIVFGATAEYLSVDAEDMSTVSRYEAKYERGIISMMTSEDPLGGSYVDTIEPDTVRHKRTTSAI